MQPRCLVTLVVVFALNLAIGALPAADSTEVVRLSEPVRIDADSETFGAALDESLPQVRLPDLVGAAEEWLGKPVRVDVRVSEVCQKKGCFLIARDGATVLRVSFRDYAFFVPTDVGGKTVTLAGELVRVERSADEASHLVDDLGTTGGLPAGHVYEIVATSVRIPRG